MSRQRHWSSMQHKNIHSFCILLCMIRLQVSCGYMVDSKVLNVGEELHKETLLQRGSSVYQLQGLKSSTWYEVKISYPASNPASLSIQLNRGDPDLLLKHQRKLLNTEKLIFKNDNGALYSDQIAPQNPLIGFLGKILDFILLFLPKLHPTVEIGASRVYATADANTGSNHRSHHYEGALRCYLQDVEMESND